MSGELFPIDGRWTCARCSRFIAAAAITWWDERDPGAYYGVTARYVVDCPRCGRLTDADALPPHWTPTRWAPLDGGPIAAEDTLTIGSALAVDTAYLGDTDPSG